MPGKPFPIKDIKDKIGIANMQKPENNSANNLVNVMCRSLSTSHTIPFQSGTQKLKDINNKDSFPMFWYSFFVLKIASIFLDNFGCVKRKI